MQPRNRKPVTPGELLQETLGELELMTGDLARHVGEPTQIFIDIIESGARITSKLASQLGGAFGQSPGFWLNAQLAIDLWAAEHDFPPTPILPQAVQAILEWRQEGLRELTRMTEEFGGYDPEFPLG